jgi:hypothetical protein
MPNPLINFMLYIFPRRLISRVYYLTIVMVSKVGVEMDVVASVDILKGDFDAWLLFFESYEHLRHEFVTNEVVTQISQSKATVSFTIIDIDGLTALSSSQFLLDGEAQLGVTVELVETLT